MNRGYTAYLKESKAAVKETFKGKGSYIKYYIWLIMVFLGNLFILPSSAMDYSVVKQSRDVLQNKQLSVFDSFDGTFRSKPFWALLLAKILYAFFFIAAILVIAFISIEYYTFCSWVIKFLNLSIEEYVLAIFLLPIFLFIVCFLVSVMFRAAPMAYVGYTESNTQSSSILSKSFKAMNNGKLTLFLNFLRVVWFNMLFLVFFSLCMFIFEYIMTTFLFSTGGLLSFVFGDIIYEINANLDLDLLLPISNDALRLLWAMMLIIEMGILLISLIAYLRLNARLTLTSSVASYALFEDLVDDKYNQNKIAVGVFVKSNKNKKIKDMSLKDVFESSSSVECAISPAAEKRVLKDLTNEIELDENLNQSFENNPSEVNQ